VKSRQRTEWRLGTRWSRTHLPRRVQARRPAGRRRESGANAWS